MSIKNIDGYLLRKAIIAGANELDKNKTYVDSLNVFPVPDGDTGTNMSLTVLAAAREVEKLNTPNVHAVVKALSSGSLRGARGNSGVILSQLFRGFAKGLENKELANNDDIAVAFRKGMETAYKAVMKPKEGTILTIAKALSDKAFELSIETDDMEELFLGVLEYGNKVLAQTQQMLPELRQAGVVDAGGKGFLIFLEAAFKSYHLDEEITVNTPQNVATVDTSAFAPAQTADIKFGYCTEFFIKLEKTDDKIEENLKKYLETVGDSIVVVGDEDIIKVHVHSNNPGLILERALKIGSLDNIKIENMRLQHTRIINFIEDTPTETKELQKTEATEETEKKDIGFVAVSMGSGIANTFLNLGVDKIIEGGQTMNPSAEDILHAVSKINADNIVILPNNKNIILTAEQASTLSKDKKLYVVPTKTIPQGISAMIGFMPERSIEDNLEDMKEAMQSVKTGHLTYAVRNTVFDNKKIEEGNILCMLEDKISIVSEDVQEGAKKLLDEMIDDGDFVSIFYGEGISEEQAKELHDYVTENYTESDVEIHYGAQSLYYYIFSVE